MAEFLELCMKQDVEAIKRILLTAEESTIEDLVNCTDLFGSSPLTISCKAGNQHLACLLLDFGASANFQDSDGNTPLMWCSKLGFVELARMLLKRGANIAISNNCGFNSLLYAAFHQHPDLVNILLTG